MSVPLARFEFAAVRWWRRCHRRTWGHPLYKPVHVDTVEDVPQEPNPRRAYLSGPDGLPKWLTLECPCGTGHTLVLSLQKTHKTHWSAEVLDARLTLRPSVDYRPAEEHRCHFWLRNGRVRWVGHAAPRSSDAGCC